MSLWYSECEQYDFYSGICSPNTGFTMTIFMMLIHMMMMIVAAMRMIILVMMMLVSGNFCQVVWAGSTSLGIGCARSPKTGKVLLSSISRSIFSIFFTLVICAILIFLVFVNKCVHSLYRWLKRLSVIHLVTGESSTFTLSLFTPSLFRWLWLRFTTHLVTWETTRRMCIHRWMIQLAEEQYFVRNKKDQYFQKLPQGI